MITPSSGTHATRESRLFTKALPSYKLSRRCRGVCSGTAEKYLAELAQKEYAPELKGLLAKLAEGTKQLFSAVAFVKQQGADYMDLYGRPLVDIAMDLIVGYLFCDYASSKVEMNVAVEDSDKSKEQTIPMTKRKAIVARRFITKNAPKIAALAQLICSGDKSSFTDFAALIGPVPEQS